MTPSRTQLLRVQRGQADRGRERGPGHRAERADGRGASGAPGGAAVWRQHPARREQGDRRPRRRRRDDTAWCRSSRRANRPGTRPPPRYRIRRRRCRTRCRPPGQPRLRRRRSLDVAASPAPMAAASVLVGRDRRTCCTHGVRHDVDIVGIRLGNAPQDEVKRALQAHSPGMRVDVKRASSTTSRRPTTSRG